MKLDYTSKLIKHSAISEWQVMEICNLKATRWNYSLTQHREWIDKNISENDYHILIYNNTKLIAYTNLVAVIAVVNLDELNIKGIGNVCTSETGKGYGNILMDEVNNTLSKNSWKGFLLCKNDLVSYYEKFKWNLVDPPIKENNIEINYMIYNFDSLIYRFDYFGHSF